MRKSIEIQTDQDKHGTPRVRVSDGYGDSGWIHIHQARPGEDPQDWLARAVAMDGVALDALEFAQDNESPAYLNGVDFDASAFMDARLARLARLELAERLPSTSPRATDGPPSAPLAPQQRPRL